MVVGILLGLSVVLNVYLGYTNSSLRAEISKLVATAKSDAATASAVITSLKTDLANALASVKADVSKVL